MTRIIVLTLGGLLTVAGVIAAIVVGPGDRVGLGSEELTTETAAMATPTSALDLVGPTLHVTATATDGPIFVGAGHRMDVDAYLAGFAHELIVPDGAPPLGPISGGADFPWRPTVEPGATAESPATPTVTPQSRDWWTASASGPGEQAIATELGDDPLRVVIMRPDGTASVAADVEFELEIDNMFTTTLIIVGIGLALVVLGVFVLRPRQARRSRGEGRSSRNEAVHQ